MSEFADGELRKVFFCVLAACESGKESTPGNHIGFEAVLKAKGVQHRIVFNRIVSLILAGDWSDLFWQYLTVGTNADAPEGQRQSLTVKEAARKAQQDTVARLGTTEFGVIGAQGDLSEWVIYNGEQLHLPPGGGV